MSHFQSQIIESPGEHGNRSSFNNKLGGCRPRSSFIQKDENGSRVQVISDFDSQDDDQYSIEMTSQKDLARINENIKNIQSFKTGDKRNEELNYDQLGVGNASHKQHQRVDELVQREYQMKDRRTQMARSLKNVDGPIFSDTVHLYQNKKMKKLILLILQGNIYLIQERETAISM